MSEALLLKNLENALDELGAIPLWGIAPEFPWEEFSTALAKTFDLTNVSLSPIKTNWEEDPLDGFGKDPFIRPLSLSPLPGSIFFVMPQSSKPHLLSLLVGKGLSDPTLQDGFLQFSFLKACEAFNQLNPYGNLTATLSDEMLSEEMGAICIDCAIKIEEKKLSARIIVPSKIHASFKSYFTMEKPPLLSVPELAHLPLSLHFEAGSTTLQSSEWEEAKVGDLVLLERCTLHLDDHKGTAILSICNTPLFDVRIKGGNAKILEYTIIQEEKPMTDETNLPEENEEHLWESKEGEEKKPLPAKKIPLTLTLEVGRFQMPLEKVTQLKPGNVLELGLDPSMSVHLTVSGKRVAKGELVRLGETVGVKILALGE